MDDLIDKSEQANEAFRMEQTVQTDRIDRIDQVNQVNQVDQVDQADQADQAERAERKNLTLPLSELTETEDSCQSCQGGPESGGRQSHHSEKTIHDLVSRMNRIEGQIRGIKGMIERHVYCDDILNQIASAQSALHGVSKLLLEKHMKSCVKEQLQAGDDQVVDEVLKTIFKLIK